MSTICDSVAKMSSRPQGKPAYRTKVRGRWNDVSWSEYYEQIQSIACSLLDLGLKPGDKLALMSNTRWEWSVTDFATMSVHGVVIPIYQTVTAEDLQFILENSGCRFLIIENRAMLKSFLTIKDQCPQIEKVILFEKIRDEDHELISWYDLLEKGKSLKKLKPKFEELLNSTSSDEMATLLYTSGTTGQPKGVVLTHTQIMSEVGEAFPFAGAHPEDTSLTFLPYAHVLGRIEQWGHMYIGFTMAYAESIEKIRSNLVEIKPTIMVAVPRIFEKIYAAIQIQMEASPLKKKLFAQALKIGLEVSEYKLSRKPLPLTLTLIYEGAQRLILGKVKAAFGGKLRFAITGGAPISSEIARFFHACEVLILEGYGLTETTAAIAVNTPYDYEFGTVGKPIGDVQFKIAEDGEILVKSKKVMKEYFENPEETEKAFTDGWFHTGDIGEITETGSLRITDRKKDLIKTAGGKYVAPQRLENLLKLNPLISQVLIHGDQKKYIVALITLDPHQMQNFARQNNLSYKDLESLTQNPKILEHLRQIVAESNSRLAAFETVKRFAILPRDFTVEAGELTPSLKIKRKFLDQKFAQQIEKLYS